MTEVATLSTRDRVVRIIANELGRHAEAITDDTTLNTLGADSLDVVAILVEIEDAFRITLPDDAIHEADSIAAVVSTVEIVLAGAGA